MNNPVRGRRRSDTPTNPLSKISRSALSKITRSSEGSPARREGEASPAAYSLARKTGLAAVAAGILAAAVVPVAQAGGTTGVGSDRASEQSPMQIQAAKEAEIRFDRAKVDSKAAQEEAQVAAAAAEKKQADEKAAAAKKVEAEKKAKAEAAAKEAAAKKAAAEKKAKAAAAAKKAAEAKAKTAGFATGKLAAPIPNMNQTSGFGYRQNPITGAAGELHTGIDYAMACGTPVHAADGGKVVEAGWQVGGGGNRIVVEHSSGLKTTYNHLQSIGVSLGQKVAKGQAIGQLGTTGNSTGCHLHFEVVKDGQLVDPAGWL